MPTPPTDDHDRVAGLGACADAAGTESRRDPAGYEGGRFHRYPVVDFDQRPFGCHHELRKGADLHHGDQVLAAQVTTGCAVGDHVLAEQVCADIAQEA